MDHYFTVKNINDELRREEQTTEYKYRRHYPERKAGVLKKMEAMVDGQGFDA